MIARNATTRGARPRPGAGQRELTEMAQSHYEPWSPSLVRRCSTGQTDEQARQRVRPDRPQVRPTRPRPCLLLQADRLKRSRPRVAHRVSGTGLGARPRAVCASKVVAITVEAERETIDG